MSAQRKMIIKVAKIKNEERILTAAREKQLVTYNVTPTRPSANFNRNCREERNCMISFK